MIDGEWCSSGAENGGVPCYYPAVTKDVHQFFTLLSYAGCEEQFVCYTLEALLKGCARPYWKPPFSS